MHRWLALLFVPLVSILACGGGGGGGGSSEGGGAPPAGAGSYRVGAHYYLWFPQKFREGTLRARLAPPQEPELGGYSSTSVPVVEQHISWAKQYGIDFFTLTWSPTKTEFNSVISNTFLKARNIGDIQFALFYGVGDLGGGTGIIDEPSKVLFYRDLDYFADNFFHHPQYLRVGNRPVLILYVTRTLRGDYAGMFREARKRMQERGVDLYLLADEIFWYVTGHRDGPDAGFNISSDPQSGRIALFDAIFAYNMYDASFPEHAGYGSESSFISDIKRLYDRYRAALPGNVAFVPYAMPGYNDRGVRLAVDHYPIPREWSAGSGETTFFRHFIEELVYPYVDPRNNLVLLTSWNEWSEDTAIEPAALAPFTAADQSRSGTSYTAGYRYSGFGTQYLEAVRAAFAR